MLLSAIEYSSLYYMPTHGVFCFWVAFFVFVGAPYARCAGPRCTGSFIRVSLCVLLLLGWIRLDGVD